MFKVENTSNLVKTENSEVINNSCDKNNNSSTFRGKRLLSKTYGLRPRSTLRRLLIDSDICDLKPTVVCKNRGDKHAPLSKYRRKTANTRERHRMKEINDAFSTLRHVLPPIHTRRTVMSNMTKITTLKLAVAYIRALSEILDENGPTPSETTKTLLTAANLQIWNETKVQTSESSELSETQQFPLSNQDATQQHQIKPKTEMSISENINIDTLIPQTFTEDTISMKRPCREQGFFPEKNTMPLNNFSFADCDLDDNSSFWEDIPVLNDFQWSIA